jgi:tRNA dimethylallyltransferase
MKAVGVRELAAHLRGEASLQDALAAAQRETRRYAKRQLTWMRRLDGAKLLDAAADPAGRVVRLTQEEDS